MPGTFEIKTSHESRGHATLKEKPKPHLKTGG